MLVIFLTIFQGIYYFNGLMDELSEAFDSDIIQFDSAEDEIEARKLSCRCCRAFLCCTDMPELKHNKILLSEVAMRIIIDAHRPCISEFLAFSLLLCSFNSFVFVIAAFSSSDFFVRFLSRYYDNEHDFVKDNLTEIVRNVINVKEMSQVWFGQVFFFFHQTIRLNWKLRCLVGNFSDDKFFEWFDKLHKKNFGN